MKTTKLTKITRDRIAVERATERLHTQIRYAHGLYGVSLRDIAQEAGMSHESVRKVVNSTKT